MDIDKIIDKASGRVSGSGGFLDGVERGLAGIGLGQPVVRLGVGFGLGWMAMAALRPSFAYDSAGNARPWQMLDQENPDAAVVPWWMPALGGAALLGLFI